MRSLRKPALLGLVGVASFGLGSGVTTSAQAAKPKVLVLPYQAMNKDIAPELTEQTTLVVSDEMQAAGVEVIRSDDLFEAKGAGGKKRGDSAGDAPLGDPGAQAKALELVQKGESALEDEEFADSARHLRAAIKLLEDNGDAVDDLRLLADLYLKLGVALFRNGDEDEGDDALAKAVHYSPDRRLSEKEWPPIFIRIYDRARYNVLKRPRARVEVKGQAGAAVLFDGRNLGKAPLILADALPGVHWVRLESPGQPPKAKRIALRGNATIVLEFGGEAEASPAEAAEGVAAALVANQLQKGHVDQARDAGRKAGVDVVMLGAIYKTATAYNIYTIFIDVQSGKVGRLVDVAFDLDMLSAQIEVFKLAEDAAREAKGSFSRPEEKLVFAIAPQVRLQKKKGGAAPAPTAKVTTVAAAPPPIDKPQTPTVAERGAVAAGTGPGGPVKPPRTQIVPKDEEETGRKARADRPQLTSASVVPKDEDEDEGGGFPWWVWALAGVAVVGAGVGIGVAASGGSSDQGSLGIRW